MRGIAIKIHHKIHALGNFSNTIKTYSLCYRPENEEQLKPIFACSPHLLARGSGLSYSDCNLNHNGSVIDTGRLNHFLSFDSHSQIAIVQGGVRFADLFLLDPHFIPPVIPGTLLATIAGGVANDVHGKNNPQYGSLGDHIVGIDLQLGDQTYHCSANQNKALFYATIGGLGLTGIIKRVAIKMRKATSSVLSTAEKYDSLAPLFVRMSNSGLNQDYQVAWLDLCRDPPLGLLLLANHTENESNKKARSFKLPKLPFRLVYNWTIRSFNRYYFTTYPTHEQVLPLSQFNNPLDTILNWNYLYGKKGLVQFQAVFDAGDASNTLQDLIRLIRKAQVTPSLAVLKYFTRTGPGWLSFCQPGFTLSIDFPNSPKVHELICKMNAYLTEIKGKNYLAKDCFLTQAQFQNQYPLQAQFKTLLLKYNSAMRSNLSQRLGITL